MIARNEIRGAVRRPWLRVTVAVFAVALALHATANAQQGAEPSSPPAVAWDPSQLEGIAADVIHLSVMNMTVADLPKLSRFDELRDLHIVTNGVALGPEEGRILAGLPKLEVLGIVQVRIEPGFFGKLGALPGLKKLSLFCEYADGIWSELAELRALHTIWLKEPELDAEAMQQMVAAAPRLSSFSLLSDVSMGSKALLPLGNLRSLRELDLSRTDSVDSEVVTAIVQGKPIESLALSGCYGIDGKAVAALRSLAPEIRRLAIDGTTIASHELSRLVRDMPKLDDLSIGGSGSKPLTYEPELMAAVLSCSRLQRLAFVNMEKVDLFDLEPLTSMRLEELSLYGTPFEDAALKKLFANGPRRLRLPGGRWITTR